MNPCYKTRFIFIGGIIVLFFSQSSLALETWTSSKGSKIEARLIKLDDDGNYVFEGINGQQKAVKPEQLSEESRLRAKQQLSDSAKGEVDTKTKKVTGTVFFGIEVSNNSSSQTPSSQQSKPTNGSQSIAGTTWAGKSPWHTNNKTVTIYFEEDRVHWKGKSNTYKSYKQTAADQFQIKAKAYTLFVKIINDQTMTISVDNVEEHTSTFRRK